MWRDTLLVDFDGTLVDTDKLFLDAQRRMNLLITKNLNYNVTAAEIRAAFTTAELINFRDYGVASGRHGVSMGETYESLCQIYHIPVDLRFRDRLVRLGYSPYRRVPHSLDLAEEILFLLDGQYRVVIYSQGDPQTQYSRIERTPFRSYRYRAVREKTPLNLRRTLGELCLRTDQVIMIGNSVKFDINPASASGIPSVYLSNAQWALEQEPMLRPEMVRTVSHWSAIPAALVALQEEEELARAVA